ncbi:MAG: tRNA uridine(34) 5-carboxymethylaminomethyl modification radical SAM/GNAT enzyme Elp3 [bacterium]
MAIYALNKIDKNLEDLVFEIVKNTPKDKKVLSKLIKKYSEGKKGTISRSEVVMTYRKLCDEGKLKSDNKILELIQMKPTRTQSGVVPVTVLTRPFECPGQCIFCPTDIRMPKSYLKDEPGAQRALNNSFDPFLQVYNRIRAFENMGHTTDKIELLVLGGTWSFYPKDYQVWFVKRCFDAMNTLRSKGIMTLDDLDEKDLDPTLKTTNKNSVRGLPYMPSDRDQHLDKLYEELEIAQVLNSKSKHRNVGLVLETRPDWITETEVIHLRRLGATKIQIGIQSLDDEILKLNKRGHGVKETKDAIKYLRLAGFKIHAHWMPNLLGATLESDSEDFKKLFTKEISPDELKIYPTSIIETAELYQIFKRGEFNPYTTADLVDLLAKCVPHTPRYVRISRLIRDIPSDDIVEGNKNTNLREVIEKKVLDAGHKLNDIRYREIKVRSVEEKELKMNTLVYDTGYSTEYFISFDTIKDDKIAGFLRLTLPYKKYTKNHYITSLNESALIREVHVYGRANEIGQEAFKTSQHIGLGTKLLLEAERIVKEENKKENIFKKISVISAIGTREYYKTKGFSIDGMYMSKGI